MRLRIGGSTIGNSNDQAAEYNPKMSIYSKELRTLIHECLLINPYRRPSPREVFRKTQQAIDLTRMNSVGHSSTNFTPYVDPILSARWYLGQANGDPSAKTTSTIATQLAGAEQLLEGKFTQEKQKLKQDSSQARVSNAPDPPSDAPNSPSTSTATPKPTHAPPGSGAGLRTPANMPLPEKLPTPIQVPPRSGFPNIIQVTCIVRTKTFFGAHVFKHYTIKNLSPETLVLSAKKSLAATGCGIPDNKQIWMIGRALMGDFMKLGEFEKLADGKGIVRVCSR
ncbi:hypothetical protein IFR04_001255 [Cadophora malorum]|uniref:Protein kinase domain-containing protein n=1 Tax=Cadophora malorum TaxID=108018 RepID=A0A8H8BVV2_9HELO|nr:hypothetical protein IFR04_001255 [Cadophora malorum]